MEFNKLVVGGLALGCMAAAAGGGYLAARQSAPAAEPAIVAPAPDHEASKPVSETEGVITPEDTPAPATPARSEPAVRAPREQSTPRPSRATPASEPRTAVARSSRSSAPPARSAPAPVTHADPAPSTPASPATIGGMWETRPAVTPQPAPVVDAEPEAPLPPAAPEIEELVVPADAVLGLQIERTVSSETARVEDRVEARVTRDVRVGDKVAIPAGSVVQGSVMEVERGGKVKERARLGIRFHTVVLANGSRLNIRTDSVIREGSSPAKESAAKIGGAAIGGAILGAILGGGKGAVIGGATGAAGGTAATMAGERNPAVLNAGTTVSVRVQQPVTVTVEK